MWGNKAWGNKEILSHKLLGKSDLVNKCSSKIWIKLNISLKNDKSR